MLKADIRKLIRQRKRQHTEQQLRELSLAVNGRLLSNPRLRVARTVLLYYSMADEVDTHGLADRLVADGKTVLLPRVSGEESMDLVPYTGRDSLKPCGAFHILEPQGEPYTDYAAIDVAIVPGVAFTRDGRRMGRGRGYYDRLLPLLHNAYKIGLCFPFQLLDDIPTDNHDVVMDAVVS